MGYGSWNSMSYDTYTKTTRGVDSVTFSNMAYTAQEMYTNRHLDKELNPKNVMRKCSDCEEHPNTVPVILALDVTGSMGDASVKVAKKLNEIMTELYNDASVPDIEFCIMGIGDLAYDDAPIQMSQFESDIRIAEQLDKIYFEAGGGGNHYESYTAAWYMGLYHTDLDCWKRGQKGIIITLGDELPNPYLPLRYLKDVVGSSSYQSDIETNELYSLVTEKFDIYHIAVDDKSSSYQFYKNRSRIDEKWQELLGNNYKVANLNNLSNTIIDIVKGNYSTPIITSNSNLNVNENNEVTW